MKNRLKKEMLYMAILVFSTGCASTKVAKDVKLVAFDENIDIVSSIGNIEGKDCTWSVLGYRLGETPTVYRAFLNTMNQQDGGGIPLVTAKAAGTPLKAVRNVSISNEGFSAWVVGKSCIVVTGAGYR